MYLPLPSITTIFPVGSYHPISFGISPSFRLVHIATCLLGRLFHPSLTDLACSILPHHGARFMLMPGSLAIGTRQRILLLLSFLLPILLVLLTSTSPSTELVLPPLMSFLPSRLLAVLP